MELFLINFHYHYGHIFSDYVRAVIHLEFAILNFHSLLKSIEVRCLTCRKDKAKTVASMMAELPIERLGYHQPPFTKCGLNILDFFTSQSGGVLRSDGASFLPQELYIMRLSHPWTRVHV